MVQGAQLNPVEFLCTVNITDVKPWSVVHKDNLLLRIFCADHVERRSLRNDGT